MRKRDAIYAYDALEVGLHVDLSIHFASHSTQGS